MKELLESRVNAVGISTGYGLKDQGIGVRVPVEARIFTPPCRPDRLWGTPSLLSSGSFPGCKYNFIYEKVSYKAVMAHFKFLPRCFLG
jgi:hypothetical protein